MAIGAFQLHQTVGTAQIDFQVYFVIELDGAWVRIAGSQHRELRVAVIESANVRYELRFAVRGFQIRMTLCASPIAGAGQPERALMLYVAVGTRWREGLVGLMDWTIMAGQARLVGGAFLIARLKDMARAAFLSEQCVRVRQRTGVVRLWTPRHSMPAKPSQAQDHENSRENPTPT